MIIYIIKVIRFSKKLIGYFITYLQGGFANFMPKNIYYEDVKIIKKPLKKRLKRFLNFFVILIVFVATILGSVLLSKAISVGGISSLVIYGDTNIKIKKHNLYAVILGKYDDIAEAEKVSLTSNIQGASGYIWKDDKYMVIGNIYPTLEESQNVIKNLAESNYNTEIFTITFPEINLQLNDYDNSAVSKIEKIFKFFDNVYDDLYQRSIDFDRGEINNFAISSEISEIRGECKINISDLQNILAINNDKVNKLQSKLILLDEILNETILKTIDNSTTAYTLKNSLSKVVRLKFDLYIEM